MSKKNNRSEDEIIIETKPKPSKKLHDSDKAGMAISADNWWLELSPVDLSAKLVTIQRGSSLIAAITPRSDGRLRVAVYDELDDKCKDYLVGLGLQPHPVHGVCMRENNWEYALDCSAGSGNLYAAEKGEAYLSYWGKGLGVSADGSQLPVWFSQRQLIEKPITAVSKELGGHKITQ